MGAPAASRLRVAALLALRRGDRACAAFGLALRPALRPVRFDAHVLGPGCAAFGLAGPALRPVRFDAHVLGPGCAAFGLAGPALRPTPRRLRAAGPAPAPLEGSP